MLQWWDGASFKLSANPIKVEKIESLKRHWLLIVIMGGGSKEVGVGWGSVYRAHVFLKDKVIEISELPNL